MNYVVETTPRFDKEFKKLDHYTKRIIKSWVDKNLVNCENPRFQGKALVGNKSGLWRYRIGDYRLIASIEDIEEIFINRKQRIKRTTNLREGGFFMPVFRQTVI